MTEVRKTVVRLQLAVDPAIQGQQEALQSLKRLQAQADDIKVAIRASAEATPILRRIEQQGQSIGNTLRFAFSAYVVTEFVGALGRGAGALVALHARAEETRIAITGIHTAINGGDWESAARVSAGVFAGLRRDAAAGVGELQDYAEAYQRLVGPLSALGRSSEEIREVVRLTLGTGFALRGQEGMSLAVLDVLQGLQGGLSPAESQVLAPLLGATGSSLQQLNAAAKPEKFELILGALRSMQPAVAELGKTWSAQVATARDGVSEIARVATAPLYERWVEQLTRVNLLLDQQRESLTATARLVGQQLVGGYDAALGNAGGLSTAGVAGLAVAVGARSAPLAEAGGAALGVGAAGSAAAAIGGLVVAAVGVKTALEHHPELWGQLQEAGGRLWAAFGGTWEALGHFSHLFMSGGPLDLVGQFLINGLTTGANAMAHFVDAVNSLIAAAGDFMGPMSSGLAWLSGEATRQDVGDAVYRAVDGSIGGVLSATGSYLQGLVEPLGWAAYDPYREMTAAGIRVAGVGSLDAPVVSGASGTLASSPVAGPALEDLLGGESPVEATTRMPETKAPKRPAPVFTGPITVQVQVEQAADPHQVAWSMDQVFSNLERYRLSARNRALRPG